MERNLVVSSGKTTALQLISCMRQVFTVLLAISLLAASGVDASTYYVDAARPDDSGDGLSWGTAKQTIQAAIYVSIFGDTILVKYGAYNITSAIQIDSTRCLTSDDGTHDSWDSAVPDSSLCIVAASSSRVFTITGAMVESGTRLRGFMVTGGEATSESLGSKYGGGIYIAGGADPVIENCWITLNTATTSSTGYGGGISCRGSGTEPVIRYCRIDGNTASTSWYGYGGGIHCDQSTVCQILDNTVTDNVGSTARAGFGGGIYGTQATLDILNNTVTSNVASTYGGYGGGIYVYRGTVEIMGNVVTYNHACERINGTGNGGGIYTSGSGTTLIHNNSAISYNTASTRGAGSGGGIWCDSGYTEFIGNIIEHNTAAGEDDAGNGGGLYFATYSSNPVSENVISSNTASVSGLGKGGGICNTTAPEITRNIIAFNIASEQGEGYGGGCWFSNSGSTVFANNTVYGNANTIGATGSGTGSGLYHDSGNNNTVVNNIFAGHDVINSDGLGLHYSIAWTVHYNCFHDNSGGDYNVNVTSNNEVLADPRFNDPASGDFTLMYDSPCIEEGDPTYDVPANGAWVVDIGALEYTGVRHWRPVTGTGEILFGGMVKAKVNVTTLGTLSEIDMVVHPGETHPAAPVSVERWYEIDHVGTGMEFDLTLSYLESELSGRAEDSLSVWRWTGSAWDGPKSYSARDLDENWIAVAGQTDFSDWIMTDDWGPTSAGDIPGRNHLFANYPNPFNPATVIIYQLARPSHVRLAVYDAAGRLIRVLEDSRQGEGLHRTVWNGMDRRRKYAASGIYFYQIKAGDFVQTRKMVLLR